MNHYKLIVLISIFSLVSCGGSGSLDRKVFQCLDHAAKWPPRAGGVLIAAHDSKLKCDGVLWDIPLEYKGFSKSSGDSFRFEIPVPSYLKGNVSNEMHFSPARSVSNRPHALNLIRTFTDGKFEIGKTSEFEIYSGHSDAGAYTEKLYVDRVSDKFYAICFISEKDRLEGLVPVCDVTTIVLDVIQVKYGISESKINYIPKVNYLIEIEIRKIIANKKDI